MATHLVAWQQSVDQATLARINGVTDTVLTPLDATRFLTPLDKRWIHWGYAGGISLTRAQIHSPSIDSVRMLVEISPRKRGTDESVTRTAVELWKPIRPIELQPNEALEVQTAEDGAGATQQTAFVALGPATLPPMPEGGILPWRLTGTTTLTARAWTAVTLTPDNAFPPGTYAIVGFLAFGASPVAARLLFQGGGYRPGSLAIPATEAGAGADFAPAEFWAMWGYEMGRFTHLTIPQVEVFATAADTAQTVYFYLIRVGPGPGQAGA